MKEIIEQLKERKIDKKLQGVVNFATVTGLSKTEAYEKALHSTFLQMIEDQGEDFENAVIECILEEGLKVLFKEMNIQPSKDIEVDNDIKILFGGLSKLADLLKGEK